MSGDGKRSVGKLPQATAPILDSTIADAPAVRLRVRYRGHSCRASSLARRRVRREVADIEHRLEQFGLNCYGDGEPRAQMFI
jgi:hypothetical protein